MRSRSRLTEMFPVRAVAAWVLAIATMATPIEGISQAASPNKIGEANVIQIPANVAIVLLAIVTQKDAYALRLIDDANNVVDSLPLTDRGSVRVCLRAQIKARRLKVVGVSLRDERVLAAIARWEPDNQVYDVSVWDQSTPQAVRVVATAKLDVSGITSASCGEPQGAAKRRTAS